MDGIEAHWVQGRPVAGDLWEPGTMTVLAWEEPSGDAGIPQQYAVASNTLTVEELREIAESLR